MKFGLQAEEWAVELLTSNGHQVIRATDVDDKIYKVDFWVAWNGCWLAIQFSVDRRELVGQKGIDALHRGIVPSWLDGQELEVATNGSPNLRPKLLRQFWAQVEQIVAAYPQCKLRRPAVSALQNNGRPS